MVEIRKIIESVEGINEGILNEASFSASKLEKVSNLLASVIGHTFGDFKQLGGSLGKESFKKKGLGEGQGFKYMNNKGYMIRFGWLKKSKKSKFQINVVDFWNPKDGKKRWDTPTMTIKLADWMNIVDVVQELKEVLINGDTNSLGESLGKEEVPMFEAVNKKLIAYAKTVGITDEDDLNLSPHKLITKMKKDGVWNETDYKGFSVTKHKTEKNSTEDAFQNAEKALAEKKWSDPELVFDDIEKMTKVVAAGLQNGLIVAGMAGLGKCAAAETQIPVFGL